ncbi:hypothetical protein ACOSP7_020984 [Xanthoceras sorbifolium]
MTGIFNFSAQPSPTKLMEMKAVPPSENPRCKRARAENEEIVEHQRRKEGESFKLKLLNIASPGSWSGFGAGNEKLRIDPSDIVVVEGLSGPVMKLSSELKLQLYKP